MPQAARAPRSSGRPLRALVSVAGLLTFLASAVAEACPYCAGRSDSGIGRGIALTLFVLLPFAVVYVVVRFIRTGERPAYAKAQFDRAPLAGVRGALPTELSS